MQNTPPIKRVAVLGAGTMGAKIAAHMANAHIPAVLFDLPSKTGDKSAIATQAIAALSKDKPASLASPESLAYLTAANYDDDIALLESCDLIIEAIAENVKFKHALFKKISTHLAPHAILATNTSGLSIGALAKALPAAGQKRFCGLHFFNPPRYMPLIEVIPHAKTDAAVLTHLEPFLVSTLGKSIVYAKDTPNFIANRVGSFSLLVTCHYTEQFNVPLEVVDNLTGVRIGRPKSATYRTLDLVGLDVLSHVIGTMAQTQDSWHKLYKPPTWIEALIKQGALGEKTKKGLYCKTSTGLSVLDLGTQDYRPVSGKADKAVAAILKEKNVGKRFTALRASSHPEAQFLWNCFRELFLFVAHTLADIAHTAFDVDLAMRLGFGWTQGPFELWQDMGWTQVISWIQDDIKAGKALSAATLPAWVSKIDGAYCKGQVYSAHANKFVALTRPDVYERQCFPAAMPTERTPRQKILFENEGLQLWTTGDNIGIISFKTKMCTISTAVLEGLTAALEYAESNTLTGLIIWQKDQPHFSAGADLMEFAEQFLLEGAASLAPNLETFQQTLLSLRYANRPIVAATRGYVLGGGCELMMHCDKTVAALESYIGLVEVGVGIIPAAGGCKEMALRASRAQNPAKALQDYYKNIAMARAATSAAEAKTMGYLRTDDVIVMHPDELLYVAKQQCLALASTPYSAPLPPKIAVQGMPAKATIQLFITNMQAGHFASEHDALIATKLATVMCGGDLDAGSLVDEAWLLRLEREAFLSLIDKDKTQARVEHMLTNGKPLRN
jgi:3-hydroxyacyl-CoA dehydrogenase